MCLLWGFCFLVWLICVTVALLIVLFGGLHFDTFTLIVGDAYWFGLGLYLDVFVVVLLLFNCYDWLVGFEFVLIVCLSFACLVGLMVWVASGFAISFICWLFFSLLYCLNYFSLLGLLFVVSFGFVWFIWWFMQIDLRLLWCIVCCLLVVVFGTVGFLDSILNSVVYFGCLFWIYLLFDFVLFCCYEFVVTVV